jgi:hypothetical protein
VIRIEAGVGVDETVADAVGRIVDSTEPRIREVLPGLAQFLTLQVRATQRVIPETGTGGSSLSAGVITWSFDPGRPEGGAALAERWLASTLFHESHHQVRGWPIVGGGGPHSFVHAVVCEGLATAFERDQTGLTPLRGMYPPEAPEWVKEIQELSTPYNFRHWMFSHPDGRRWIGYRAGTYIADQATRASGRTAADLVTVPTSEILEMAGLKPLNGAP